MNFRRELPGILIAQAILLGLLGWHFRHALNADAVAYLRLGSYYAEGKCDLAVSGYWGPLLSWLVALGLKLGFAPLVVARGLMALSALAFGFGAAEVYRALKLSASGSFLGTVLAALASAYWSVQFITPDLLLSAWIFLAISRMLDGRWVRGPGPALATGCFWGLAYLTKAIALPLGVGMIWCCIALEWRRTKASERAWLRPAAMAVAAFMVVALPWMLVLSGKYGRPTFSTTARISHTLTGPPDRERYHPFARTFHQPESGRVTSWEEPSRMDYEYWSPFASAAYAQHEGKVFLRNLGTAFVLLTSLNLFWPALLLAWSIARRGTTLAGQLPRVWLLPALSVLAYLPCYFTITEQRFFYQCFPLWFGGLALCGQYMSDLPARWHPLWKILGHRSALLLATVGPLLAQMVLVGDRTLAAGEVAAQLSDRLRAAHLSGSFAGSANLPGGRTGLFVAYHLGQPWLGDEPRPNPASIRSSGADYFLANRGSVLARELATDDGFENLDPRLFTSAAEASQFPTVVFRIKR